MPIRVRRRSRDIAEMEVGGGDVFAGDRDTWLRTPVLGRTLLRLSSGRLIWP